MKIQLILTHKSYLHSTTKVLNVHLLKNTMMKMTKKQIITTCMEKMAMKKKKVRMLNH